MLWVEHLASGPHWRWRDPFPSLCGHFTRPLLFHKMCTAPDTPGTLGVSSSTSHGPPLRQSFPKILGWHIPRCANYLGCCCKPSQPTKLNSAFSLLIPLAPVRSLPDPEDAQMLRLPADPQLSSRAQDPSVPTLALVSVNIYLDKSRQWERQGGRVNGGPEKFCLEKRWDGHIPAWERCLRWALHTHRLRPDSTCWVQNGGPRHRWTRIQAPSSLFGLLSLLFLLHISIYGRKIRKKEFKIITTENYYWCFSRQSCRYFFLPIIPGRMYICPYIFIFLV